MKINILKSKIHKARVTKVNLHYQGSLAIDKDIMDKAGLYDYEKILVANLNNGNRFETYVIAAERDSRTFLLNGAAAHKGKVGDLLIIMSFAIMSEKKAKVFKPKILVLNSNNELKHNE